MIVKGVRNRNHLLVNCVKKKKKKSSTTVAKFPR